MSAPLIRVMVVDDQAIVRDGLVTVLSLLPDIDVVAEASDGEAAVRLAAEFAPDVVLMDLRMPVLDGTAATARILAERPGTAVLVLTTFGDDASISGALRVGARGYLTKDASRAEVAAAIRSVANGQATFAPEVGARLIGRFTTETARAETAPVTSAPVEAAIAETARAAAASPLSATSITPAGIRSRFAALTQREAEVLALMAAGLSNTEIAARLFVSIATVKTHINSLFAKLHVQGRAQAIAAAHGQAV